MVALLAGEALEVVDVSLGAHHHLEGGDHLVARRAVPRRAEQSEGERREIWIECQCSEGSAEVEFTTVFTFCPRLCL